MIYVPSQKAAQAARRAILAAGGEKDSRDWRRVNRACLVISERLGVSRQAVLKWYKQGIIPKRRVAALQAHSAVTLSGILQ